MACFAGILLAASTAFSQAALRSEALLPDTTKGFVSTFDLARVSAQWEKTQVGQLMKDPMMKPFSEDLQDQMQERFAEAHVKLGLTWDDIKGVPSGEVAAARIQPAPGKAALAIVMDVTGRRPQAEGLVKKAAENLVKSGAKASVKAVGADRIHRFDLPKDDGKAEQMYAFYFLSDTWLIVSDSEMVIGAVIDRAAGKKAGRTLGDVEAFQKTMARCQKEVGQQVPQIRWFVEPFGYYEVLDVVNPERFTKQRKGKSMFQVLKETGFTAIQGAGGFVDFSVPDPRVLSGGYEVLHRTAVYAPPPYQQAAKMMVLPNAKDLAPQPWVPRDVATYTTIYVDVQNAFNHFGPLYDALFGNGAKGVWDDTLGGLIQDPNGPQIDLNKELVAHLGQRLTTISDYELPITPTSERLLYAIETRDEKAAAAGIEKWFRNDKTVQKRQFGDFVIWESVPAPARRPLRNPNVVGPPLPGAQPLPNLGPKRPGRQPAQQKLLPTAAVTVAHNQLFIASHIEFLQKALAQGQNPQDSLGQRLDFKLVDATLNQFGVPDNCARLFSRTDEEYRPTYELVKQGKMPESKTMLGRALNRFMGAGKQGVVRKQEIDGAKLPNYDVVRRCLGPAGTLAYGEAEGWFLIGFTLKK
jgi:hypothetical protein